MGSKNDPKTVNAVERALDLLDAFLGTSGRLSLDELCTRTNLYKSTILRLAFTLESRGYLVRTPQGMFQIGAKHFQLGASYQATRSPVELIMPLLEDLSAVTGESASFNVRHENIRIVLCRVDSKHIIRDHLRAGDVRPLGLGAAGQVLSAFTSDNPEYAEVRRKLIASGFGEIEADMAGIASPVFDSTGQLAGAISVSGPLVRFKGAAVANIRKCVYAAAAKATQHFGGPTDRFEQKKTARSTRTAGTPVLEN